MLSEAYSIEILMTFFVIFCEDKNVFCEEINVFVFTCSKKSFFGHIVCLMCNFAI